MSQSLNVRVIDRRVMTVGDWRKVTLPFSLFVYGLSYVACFLRDRIITSRVNKRRTPRREVRVSMHCLHFPSDRWNISSTTKILYLILYDIVLIYMSFPIESCLSECQCRWVFGTQILQPGCWMRKPKRRMQNTVERDQQYIVYFQVCQFIYYTGCFLSIC